jgi:SAM-dependent methyltransferase
MAEMSADARAALRRTPPGQRARVRWILQHVGGGRILDVGFVGESSSYLHQALQAYGRIMGVDIDAAAIACSDGKDGLAADVTRLPFRDGSFDRVVLGEVIEHLPRPFDALRETARVLRPWGTLLVTTPNPYSVTRWLRHYLLAQMPPRRATLERFMGAVDHLALMEPMSLARLLGEAGLVVTRCETRGLGVPGLRRLWRAAHGFDLRFFPFSRVSGYTCMMAEKREREANERATR